MNRSVALPLLAVAAFVGVEACSKEGGGATTVDPCAYGNCGDGAAETDAGRRDAGTRDASVQDASIAPGDGSAGTGVIGWDGRVPPSDEDGGGSVVPIRDAEWAADGVSGPTGPIAPGPLPESTPCGAGPAAFGTQDLQVVAQGPGAMPAAFASQWSAAVGRGGAPGPGVVVLADTGAVDGGARRLRFGAAASGASGYAFVQSAGNPLGAAWTFTPAAYVEGSAAAPLGAVALLRFKTASGSNVDVPVVEASLQGAIRGASGDAGECVSLGNTVLTLVLPAAAGSLVLEGRTLESTLGAATAQPSGAVGWSVRLFGTLPKVAFAGVVP